MEVVVLLENMPGTHLAYHSVAPVDIQSFAAVDLVVWLAVDYSAVRISDIVLAISVRPSSLNARRAYVLLWLQSHLELREMRRILHHVRQLAQQQHYVTIRLGLDNVTVRYLLTLQ